MQVANFSQACVVYADRANSLGERFHAVVYQYMASGDIHLCLYRNDQDYLDKRPFSRASRGNVLDAIEEARELVTAWEADYMDD